MSNQLPPENNLIQNIQGGQWPSKNTFDMMYTSQSSSRSGKMLENDDLKE